MRTEPQPINRLVREETKISDAVLKERYEVEAHYLAQTYHSTAFLWGEEAAQSWMKERYGYMFNVNELTIEDIDKEYAQTLDKLERLSKLREAVSAQDNRRIDKLIEEYNRIKKEQDGRPSQEDVSPRVP